MESTAGNKYNIAPIRGGRFSHWTATDKNGDTRNEVLVVLYGFFGATQRTIAKYCDI